VKRDHHRGDKGNKAERGYVHPERRIGPPLIAHAGARPSRRSDLSIDTRKLKANSEFLFLVNVPVSHVLVDMARIS
jgi:hypothetical protein